MVAALAVTDSHALIWAATGQHRKLGRSARRMFAAVEAGTAAVYVPAMAVAEISEAVRTGDVSFHIGFSAWITALFGSGRYHHADLTLEVLLRAEELYAIPERADRLIAATAAVLGYPLMTRDPEITRVAGVEYLW